jgi:Phage P22-like portal protein
VIWAPDTSKADQEILEEALKRFKGCEEAESIYRPDCLLDQKFVDLLDQWPEAIKKNRKNKVMLVVDHLGTTVHQIVNDIRQNKLGIKIRPRGGGADIQKAKARQAAVRYVENRSHVPALLDYGAESAVKVGEGFIRVRTERVNDDTNEQDIIVERILNWAAVHLDPDRQKPDGSDAMYGFIIDEVGKTAPELEGKNLGEWKTSGIGDTQKNWFNGDAVRIAEYFRLVGKGKARKCEWFKLAATTILERTDIPCRYVPIVEIVGEESFVEGKRYRRGVVRRSKDAQTRYNVMVTAETERIAQMPKGKWIGTKRQFEGLDQLWKGANTDDTAYLPFNVDPQHPQRPDFVTPEAVPASLIQAQASAREDIKATTGIFDASLGNRSNETSGKAIMARQHEGDTSNYHYTDNLTRSVQHLGCIILDMFPKVYDTKRLFHILGDDGKEVALAIKMSHDEAQAAGATHFIQEWEDGDYEAIVETGPSYATKRQETAEALLQLADKLPALQEVAPDLIVEAFDFDKGQDMADRLRKKMGIETTDEQGNPTGAPPPDPAMVQQMQQAQMENAALKDQLGAATQAANDKQSTEQLKADTEIKKAQIDSWTKIQVAQIQVAAKAQAAAVSEPSAPAAPEAAENDAISPAMAEMLHGLMEGLNELRAQVARLGNTAPAPVADEPVPAPNAGMGQPPESFGAIQ